LPIYYHLKFTAVFTAIYKPQSVPPQSYYLFLFYSNSN